MPEKMPIDSLPQPAMVIDVARPEIREANARARRLWGLADAISLPVALDPAMPAIKQLAQECGKSGDQQAATLVFWTYAGAQSLRCSFERSTDTDTDTMLVTFEHGGASNVEPEAAVRASPAASDPSMAPADDGRDVHAMIPALMPALAHELRTPIGAIIALAEMIETEQFGAIGDPRYREYARDIGDSARLSLGIVASSLEQNAGDTDLIDSFAELNLAELILKCVRTVRQSALEAKITLRQVVPDDLPHLIANGPGLTQILLNLLSNAVKFTPEGGTVTVEVTATTEGGIRLSVRDTGVGMTVIDASVLIADQQRDAHRDAADTSDEPLPARRGIGFSLVRRLADAMSAKFEIDSTRGVGTLVSLAFPADKVIPMAAAQNATRNAD